MHLPPLRTSHAPLHPQLRRTVSLFAGIGLLDLGLEQAGLGETLAQVEIDPFASRVLARHWPFAERHRDVRDVGKKNLPRADLLCGGFPCTDVSLAGKRAGLAGERSGLWFEYARIIEELRPKAVVIENVVGLRTSGLRRVLADLAALGFDAEWACLAAADLGAPHLRRRIFIVATDPNRLPVWDEPGWLERAYRQAASEHRFDPEGFDAADTDGLGRLEQARRVARQRGWPGHCGWDFDPATGVDDGRTARVGRGRGLVEAKRKALGNAVVVACAKVTGRALIEATTRPPEKWQRQDAGLEVEAVPSPTAWADSFPWIT